MICWSRAVLRGAGAVAASRLFKANGALFCGGLAAEVDDGVVVDPVGLGAVGERCSRRRARRSRARASARHSFEDRGDRAQLVVQSELPQGLGGKLSMEPWHCAQRGQREARLVNADP